MKLKHLGERELLSALRREFKEREKRLAGFAFPEKYNLSAAIMGIGIAFSF
ncbi:unnamed protein product [marine sediment metagenome]|uniref:Uncharacterized protein n=1 Tax=marine sediment metagenome TaxID=412755 RepID=X0WT91_9ZZZZ